LQTIKLDKRKGEYIMFKKSLKCYFYFLVTTLALVLIMDQTRTQFLNLPGIMAFAYLIGASVWFAVPGLICFWLNYRRGYIKWGQASLITGLSIIGLASAFFHNTSIKFIIIIAGIMTVPVSIGIFLVLVYGMKIQAKNDDRIITVNAEPEWTENEMQEISNLLDSDDDPYRYRSGE
jgi:hypothetical protein